MYSNPVRLTKAQYPFKNKYILLRHGQTEANNKKIYMGRLDYDLNDTGREQARAVELPLKPDLVFNSPLKRTTQTMEIVVPGHEHMADSRLMEKDGGDIQGMAYADIAAQHSDIWDSWGRKELDEIVRDAFPNGESDLQVAMRLEEFLAELEANYENKVILLVTHSGVIQAARYLLGGTKDDIYLSTIGNCHIDLVE